MTRTKTYHRAIFVTHALFMFLKFQTNFEQQAWTEMFQAQTQLGYGRQGWSLSCSFTTFFGVGG